MEESVMLNLIEKHGCVLKIEAPWRTRAKIMKYYQPRVKYYSVKLLTSTATKPCLFTSPCYFWSIDHLSEKDQSEILAQIKDQLKRYE